MPRIQSLDLARGFTVLIMPSIHVVMLYSQPSVQQSLLGDILAFIAEGPGAQVFMMIMGISFTFSSRINKRSVLQRAFYLLLAAYALNFLKFVVPLLFDWMPENLLQELHLTDNYSAISFFLFLGDILHFAAIAYLILYLVYLIPRYQYWSLLFAIMIIFFSPLVWDLHTANSIMDYLLQLAGGHPPNVFFPLFPWLVYPLAGLTFGYYLHQYEPDKVFAKAGWLGLLLVIVTCLFPATIERTEWLPFYRTGPVDTIFHVGFILLWLGIIHWITKRIPSNSFFRLLIFCSKNITSIYLIQWILICWFIAFTGYQTLGFSKSFIWMLMISMISFLLAWLLNNAYAGKKSL
jgi:uncharacterized membrane protein